jgi:hypothetical protein
VLEGSCEGHYIVVEDMVLPEGTLIHDYTLDAKKEQHVAGEIKAAATSEAHSG